MGSVYVVVDTMGAGRVVGVFDSEARAARIVGSYGAYYKLHRCELNRIDPDVLGWATEPGQRDHLRALLDEQER